MMDNHELLKREAQRIDDHETSQIEARNIHEFVADEAQSTQPVKEIAIGSILGIRDERLARRIINPFLFYKHMPVALSTSNAESYDNLAIQWSFSNGQFNARPGIISSKDLVKNIIGMRISSGYFPWASLTMPPYQRLVYVQIAEFAHLAMSNGLVSWHFAMQPVHTSIDGGVTSLSLEDTYIDFKPSFDGYFWFPAPIQDLNTLTLRLATPNAYQDARRVPNAMRGTQVLPTNPITLMRVSTSDADHHLTTGEIIYFFSVDPNPYDQAIVDELTRDAGWVVTVVDPQSFTIPFDGTTTNITSLYWWTTYSTPHEFTMGLDLIYTGSS